MWVDISHTVKAAELKGGKLFKHLHTGETRLEEPESLTPEMEGSEPEQEVTTTGILDWMQEPKPEMPTPEIVATTAQSRKRKK